MMQMKRYLSVAMAAVIGRGASLAYAAAVITHYTSRH